MNNIDTKLNRRETCDSIFYLYEEIKKSDRVNSAGRACYVERNYWMIDESNFAIFHLDENNSTKKSGTMQVYQYVQQQINVKGIEKINK